MSRAGPWCRPPGGPTVDCITWLHVTVSDPVVTIKRSGQRVVWATRSGSVVAAESATGEITWRSASGGPVEALATAGDHVAVASGSRLVILDLAEGRKQWERAFPEPVADVVAATDVVAVVSTKGLLAVHAAGTGDELWHGQITSRSHIVIQGSRLIVGSPESGEVSAVRATDGARLWRIPVGSGVVDVDLVTTPARVVATTTIDVNLHVLGQIVEIDPADGHVIWRYDLPPDRAGRSPVAITPELVLVGAIGGDTQPLLALDRTGSVTWSHPGWRGGAVPHPGDGETSAVVSTPTALVALDRGGHPGWRFEARTLRVAAGVPWAVNTPNLVVGVVPPTVEE